MPPRVAYWTSAFEPEMEAVAAEVAVLRRSFPQSIAWGLTHRHWLRLSPRRGFCFHPRLHLLFRAAARAFEGAFQIHHVVGSLGDWFYLQAPKRRPTVLTVATHSPPVAGELLDRVSRFAVEHPGGAAELGRLGVGAERVRVILPPVDLERFAPRPEPGGPFTVLFASSPDMAAWLEGRGVPQLLDAAVRLPEVRFRLLWRPWGDARPVVERWIAERGLRNVELRVGACRDMAGEYQQAHVCVAPFADPERSKPAPNSVIESLACGRPVVVTEAVGLAGLIREGRGGLVSAPGGEALAEQLGRLQADWHGYASGARRLAEQLFGQERFVSAYRKLYEEVLAEG